MFSIARTEELRNSAMRLLEQHEKELAQNPNSFASKLMVKSAASRVADLTNRLIEQKTEREFEIVEIRLMGEAAYQGSLPMHMIGQLSSSFEETLVEIGKFAKHGTKKRKGSFTDTRKQLGAKLKRLGAGSTRMFVSVETNPDMFGGSLTEVCISRTFEILSSANSEELIETSGSVGKPALRTINRFLKSLLDFNLEADLNWFTPLDTDLTWKGNRQIITRLHESLNDITETEPIELNIEGELITQSLKGHGKFELFSQDGITISGTVPLDVLGYFVQVRIGSYCRIKVIQTVTTNAQTGKSKSFYELREINVIDKVIKHENIQLDLFHLIDNLSKVRFSIPFEERQIEVPKELSQINTKRFA